MTRHWIIGGVAPADESQPSLLVVSMRIAVLQWMKIGFVRILAAVAALAAGMTGGRPASASVDVGVQTGAVVGVEMPKLPARLALIAEGNKMWAPLPALELGIRGAVGLTTLSYGNEDGAPVIGDVSSYNPTYLEEAVTLLPAVTLASRWRLGDAARLTAALGVTFLVSGELRGYSLFPMPTAGLGLDFTMVKTASGWMRARVGVDYIALLGWSPSLVTPTLGLSWDM
jgi:hypothetical protein